MKYSFLKLYLAQWSWKNECKCAAWCLGFNLIIGCYHAFINDPYYPLVVHYLTVTVMTFASVIVYQFFKSIFMAIFCIYICNGSNNGDLDFIVQYNKALTWRK